MRKCTIGFLIVALSLGALSQVYPIWHVEAATLLYVTLLYWHQGLPFHQAKQDVTYLISEVWGATPTLLIQTKPPSQEAIALPVAADDHITAVCKTAMYTQLVSDGEVPPFFNNFETADPVSAQERVRLFLEECRAVYESIEMGSDYRSVLDNLRPGLAKDKTTPYPVFSGDPQKLRAREMASKEKPDLSSRWVPEEELGPFKDAHVRYGYRPVKPTVVHGAQQVTDAIVNGKVVKFDAREFIPKEFFNKSMVDMAKMHKDTADTIPLYRQRGASAPSGSGWESLADYASRVESYRKHGQITYPEFRPWYDDFKLDDEATIHRQMEPPTWYLRAVDVLCKLMGHHMGLMVRQMRMFSLQAAINMRRLPNAPQRIEEALGSPDWLERAWNMLWLGAVGDCWHYDDPDNLLIAVYGDIWVTVMENPEDNELLRAGGSRGCWAGPSNFFPKTFTSSEAIRNNNWIKKYPAVSFKLEPGMGVTVPSLTYHSLTMTSGDRVLLNCFFVPKYGRANDRPRANATFYNGMKQSKEYAALRSLKMTTINRVWDKHRIGGWFEASKLEYL